MRLDRLTTSLFLHAITVSTLSIDVSSFTALSQYQNSSTSAHDPVHGNDKYEVECLPIRIPRQPKLINEACSNAVSSICTKLSFPQPRITARGRWQWTSLPGCSLGYFIPDDAPASLVPKEMECKNEIYGKLIAQCGSDARYNSGGINVDYPPTSLMPGFPITPGHPRYMMAPSQLGADLIH